MFGNAIACQQVRPYSPEVSLAAVTFIAPSMCHDLHDCSIATGDAWLKADVPPMIQWGATVVITFDEGGTDTGGGGNVYTVVGDRPRRIAW